MKKHVRKVTERPYRDLKSPFHNPGEGPKRDLKLDEIFTNLIVYEGRAKYDFSGDRLKQLKEYHKANENCDQHGQEIFSMLKSGRFLLSVVLELEKPCLAQRFFATGRPII